MSFYVLTYLIGQKDRAVCKRHGLSWRYREVHIAPHAWGRLAAATKREPLEPASNWHSRSTRTLPSYSQTGPPSLQGSKSLGNCSLSYLFKETSTLVLTLERSEDIAGPWDYASWTTECLVKREVRQLFSVIPVGSSSTMYQQCSEQTRSIMQLQTLKILRSKPEIYEYLSWDADTAWNRFIY